MAVRTVETITDDIDGSENAEHVAFAFDGTSYTIDLSAENKAELAEALSLYIGNAQKSTGGTSTARRAPGRSTTGSLTDAKAVRAWAAQNDVEVPARGRIPGAVVEQYKAATS